jgi:hypothetical protein
MCEWMDDTYLDHLKQLGMLEGTYISFPLFPSVPLSWWEYHVLDHWYEQAQRGLPVSPNGFYVSRLFCRSKEEGGALVSCWFQRTEESWEKVLLEVIRLETQGFALFRLLALRSRFMFFFLPNVWLFFSYSREYVFHIPTARRSYSHWDIGAIRPYTLPSTCQLHDVIMSMSQSLRTS